MRLDPSSRSSCTGFKAPVARRFCEPAFQFPLPLFPLQLVSTEPDEISRQVAGQRRLQSGVARREPELRDLLESGRDLLQLSSGDDREHLEGESVTALTTGPVD